MSYSTARTIWCDHVDQDGHACLETFDGSHGEPTTEVRGNAKRAAWTSSPGRHRSDWCPKHSKAAR